MERERPEELLKLIRENPELPVVPFVDGGIACDDANYWIASWGRCKVDEYVVPHDNWHPVQHRSDDDVFGTLEAMMSSDEYDALPESEEECRPYYDALPWKKAIIVYINLPEE